MVITPFENWFLGPPCTSPQHKLGTLFCFPPCQLRMFTFHPAALHGFVQLLKKTKSMSVGFSGTHKNHKRYGNGMGIVREAYHKGVPKFGSPWNHPWQWLGKMMASKCWGKFAANLASLWYNTHQQKMFTRRIHVWCIYLHLDDFCEICA